MSSTDRSFRPAPAAKVGKRLLLSILLLALPTALLLAFVFTPDWVDPVEYVEVVDGTVVYVEKSPAKRERSITIRLQGGEFFTVRMALKSRGDKVIVAIYKRRFSGRLVHVVQQ